MGLTYPAGQYGKGNLHFHRAGRCQRRHACAGRSGAKPVHEMQDRYDAVWGHEELGRRPAADKSVSQTGSERGESWGSGKRQQQDY